MHAGHVPIHHILQSVSEVWHGSSAVGAPGGIELGGTGRRGGGEEGGGGGGGKKGEMGWENEEAEGMEK